MDARWSLLLPGALAALGAAPPDPVARGAPWPLTAGRASAATSGPAGGAERASQRPAPSGSAAAPPAAPAVADAAGTLGGLAERLAAELPAGAASRAFLSTDLPAPLAEALRDALARALGGGRPARVATARAALAAAGRRPALLIEARRHGTHLRLVAQLLGPAPRLWERARGRRAAPPVVVTVAGPLDVALRRAWPAPALRGQVEARVAAPDREIVALGCGRAGEAGAVRLAVLGRRHLDLGARAGESFVSAARVTLDAVGERAPTPLPEPMAAVVVTPGGVVLGSSDRADALALGPELAVVARHPRALPWDAERCAPFGALGVSPEARPCAEAGSPAPREPALADAVAGAVLAPLRGAPLLHRAARVGGAASVWAGDALLGEVTPAGAQLALGDLDDDGRPELVSARDTLEPGADGLRVHTLAAGPAPALRWELEAPGGVSAVTVCPADDEGPAWVVAAVGAELWWVR